MRTASLVDYKWSTASLVLSLKLLDIDKYEPVTLMNLVFCCLVLLHCNEKT